MYRIFNYIYSINYLGRQLLREVLNYSDEYLFEELTPRTLKKMHNFLVEHKCAETFKEIKSKNQINIKGCAPNGLERLIGKEIREQYGLDILEASEKFTTFYPIFSEGVIKYESVNGLHYTHFKVSGQTEKTFGMEIKEYKLYHNVFYLTYSIRIKEMSKHIPFYLSETVGEDIRHLLFSGPLSEEVDKEFSKLEKLMIRHTINNEQNYEEEMTIILYNTIANFRAVNFLWEKYNHDLLLHSISSDWFYDNDFFKINNWRYEIQGIKIVSSNEIKKRIAALTDEETQFRLNIWMDYRPDIICDDISIEALKSYTMFAFLEEELVVFESFEPQNAFYVFGCPNGLENLINSIAKLTKSQMTLSKWYVDRGNHISNRKSLQQRISRLFKH